ncbi:MAG: hypothetical protein QGH60_12985 [Phycisphaerae bacterium]|jgi:tetratricopeptide (TPR) repeat protein|nr:hypothetical protein [Phycisphaerae bacterium]
MHRVAIVVVCVTGVWTAGALADAKSDFDTLFGDSIKRVAASRKGKDAATLAGQMMEAAESIKDRPDLHVMLWTKAADLGAKDPSGYALAAKALRGLLTAAPDDTSRWVDKLSGIYRRRYMRARGPERVAVGAEQVDEFITIGDVRAAAGRHREAMAIYRKALSVATAIKSPAKSEIFNKIKAANAIASVQRDIERLQKTLAKDPDDTKTRTAIVQLYLIELDDPAGAAKLLTDDLDEKLRTYVLLAAKEVEDVKAGACLELGRWYWEMFPSAKTARAKANILRRTRDYIDRFLSLHTAKDLAALRAAVILKKVDAEAAKLGSGGLGGPTRSGTIADFESPRLAGWTITGSAFGKGPCSGAPPSGQSASGFAGKMMINSSHGGDRSTGTMTSPKFIIRGKAITFLVAGGRWGGRSSAKVCMDLIVDGKPVRSVLGHTSNAFRLDGWDVSDLKGKTAQVRIVDASSGSWGHIMVDQIVQHPGKLEDVLKRTKKPPPRH